MTTTSHFHARLADWSLPQDRGLLRAVREAVFVREQNIPAELEWNEAVDSQCLHVLAQDGTGQAIGTGRLKPDGQIGRLAVLSGWRGRGVGGLLLRTLTALARQHQLAPVWLDAQLQTVEFYAHRGFQAKGEPFREAGIPHRRMVLTTVVPEAKVSANGQRP
ncbi:MAG: GNAT family N-acetyltransferase [Gammaproteobacteria bacterium]